MTTIIVYVTKLIMPIRVSRDEEIEGLDYASHGERAYDIVS
mgnify:FL=1